MDITILMIIASAVVILVIVFLLIKQRNTQGNNFPEIKIKRKCSHHIVPNIGIPVFCFMVYKFTGNNLKRPVSYFIVTLKINNFLIIIEVPEPANNQREGVRAGGPRRANVGRANVRNRFRGLLSLIH